MSMLPKQEMAHKSLEFIPLQRSKKWLVRGLGKFATAVARLVCPDLDLDQGSSGDAHNGQLLCKLLCLGLPDGLELDGLHQKLLGL